VEGKALVGTRSSTPVFCDESGVRSVVMQWGGRSLGLLLLLLCAGLALTLQTRVEVPGLIRLLATIDGSSELFHAPVRRNGPNPQPVREGKMTVPRVSDQTVAHVRDLPVRKPTSIAPTVRPADATPAVIRVRPTERTAATTPSAAPTAQSWPTEERGPTAGSTAGPTAGPSIRPRKPNAAVPGEDPNAQGSAARAQAPGQLKAKSNAKASGAPSPKAGVEHTTP
jgi:hypothetical protein